VRELEWLARARGAKRARVTSSFESLSLGRRAAPRRISRELG
jgi:hypothetical protein